MADISKIKLGSTTYNIKDASAKHSVTTGDSVTVTAGTAASLSYTSRSIPNVTSVGTAPSLTYTARTVKSVKSVGSAPTLGTAIPADDITA